MSVIPAPSQRVSDEMRLQSASYYNPIIWAGMTKLAKVLIDSRAVPENLNTEAKVMVALQAGKELGISPINALNSFYIVNGKITIYGDTAIALVMRDGHKVKWGKCDAKEANVTITRADNKEEMESKFTFDDAVRKNLTKYSDGRVNPFWAKYPENMLKFKAFGSIARFIVADSLRGMSIKEEFEGSSVDEMPENNVPAISANAPKELAPAETIKIEQEDEDESASLNKFLEKKEEPVEPVKKLTRAELVKKINKVCLDNGKDPKKLLTHYKKKTWMDFKLDSLVNVLESVEKTIEAEKKPLPPKPEEKAPTPPKPVEEKVDETLPTFYMPEEETLDKVNDLLAKDEADLSEEEKNLIDDIAKDEFAGRQSARYKGIF